MKSTTNQVELFDKIDTSVSDVLEKIRKNCDSHVVAYKNEIYYATSKVILPTDESYNKQKYTESTLKTFAKLKRALVHESTFGYSHAPKPTKVEVSYTDYLVDFDRKKIRSYTVSFSEMNGAVTHEDRQYRSIDISRSIFDSIEECLPAGYKLATVRTSNNSGVHKFGGDKYNDMTTSVCYEKTTEVKSN